MGSISSERHTRKILTVAPIMRSSIRFHCVLPTKSVETSNNMIDKSCGKASDVYVCMCSRVLVSVCTHLSEARTPRVYVCGEQWRPSNFPHLRCKETLNQIANADSSEEYEFNKISPFVFTTIIWLYWFGDIVCNVRQLVIRGMRIFCTVSIPVSGHSEMHLRAFYLVFL